METKQRSSHLFATLLLMRHDYIQQCRERIPQFVSRHYSCKGAMDLNRHAWSRDMFIAPYNFFMGMPNFVIKLMAWVLSMLHLNRASHFLSHFHLGIKTRVQSHLADHLKTEIFGLHREMNIQSHPFANTLDQPVEIYLQTRNVAADITAGTLAAFTGLILFSQFTPGSISAGSVVADWAGKEHAVSQFIFGETLGTAWYKIADPAAPAWLIVLSFFLVMLVISVTSAFAGFIHNPVQKWTGLHTRRLNKMLDHLEQTLTGVDQNGYRPKDTFVGRVYDLVDWVKGLML